MSALVLDGKKLSAMLLDNFRLEIQRYLAKGLRAPTLCMILVGDHLPSKIYLARKQKAARYCGIIPFYEQLPASITQPELSSFLKEIQQKENLDGFILQLPLPAHLNSRQTLDQLLPEKDIDGLSIVNQGKLAIGAPDILPCTPAGVLKLIDLAYGLLRGEKNYLDIKENDLSGKSAVVIGRSTLVGKPTAQLLLARNATVTIAHSHTADLGKVLIDSDIIVAAAGSPRLIGANFIKAGAIAIDVGINKLSNGEIVGDVDYASVLHNAAAVSPVPGGVGPMTVAMLIANTLKLYKRKFSL
ncbi:MAG TPA: bifunctional 5,10-methylenetetrahydrofolate dehydrogenase/5,10-methenyltetrahydrofolate cyclohydrolase [Oligoflexia bacterium]|nr:bifunctional 5,10-methylenetetrahydrofolate dehydrogenase/5,10-methenyltetrahydrofolate cyclohydrolase [Oligoflexia bacterium]HMP26566.1 bifunctional 5,10-methylenetetrahydrofolate dehydrogenase/5,10-methenyltetrahydrofolate cyclohydrolase [Oligoflexia bacterium]